MASAKVARRRPRVTNTQGREITGAEVHSWFSEAIKRRPVPDLRACEGFASYYNSLKLFSVVRDPLRTPIAETVRLARALGRKLRQVKQAIGKYGRQEIRWPEGDPLLAATDAYLTTTEAFLERLEE